MAHETLAVPKWRAWLMAARPKTLPASVAPVLVGCALAYHDGVFNWSAAFAALIVALFLQIGSNFANDYFDFVKGADTPDRVGPVRVAASGLLSPRELQMGMVVVFGIAAVAGLYLAATAGWHLLWVGAAAIVAAVLYTGGPLPYGYVGLGDVFVFIFFGVVAVAGTYYVQARALTPLALAVSVPPGLLITAILVVNNLRDIRTDARAGKRTLAVLLGERGTRREYALLVGGAYAILPFLWRVGGLSPFVMLPWLTFPLALRLVRGVAQLQGTALNEMLAGTARLALVFSLLLAVGIALS
ncbi:1,4-dihydroxy-2-naphthoate polyprenyltransferase [Ardenticatena maritima]|uniref:1,4-dihydroxy-2-naphthoate octaprenyltransferase n=3 Tax=Ardenticatena maritima TaxID=872965 RepID=A0A0P6YAN1_9CHLR|nr:1,4-dihydroxy-2-naphthoate polyprenyltransferase [Ardenticatena maritima]KPL87086.1 1,4-dihydroxy-2-naphthoate prenyltransferase [Ardenticatena maritima]